MSVLMVLQRHLFWYRWRLHPLSYHTAQLYKNKRKDVMESCRYYSKVITMIYNLNHSDNLAKHLKINHCISWMQVFEFVSVHTMFLVPTLHEYSGLKDSKGKFLGESTEWMNSQRLLEFYTFLMNSIQSSYKLFRIFQDFAEIKWCKVIFARQAKNVSFKLLFTTLKQVILWYLLIESWHLI